MSQVKISFIGFGNMAQAIAKGLCKNQTLRLFAASPSLPDAVDSAGITTHFDNRAVIKEADVIIIGVKPAKVADVLLEIKPFVTKHTVIVSIAAGISLNTLANHCHPEQAIIRAMPNTPIAVGKGATALIANHRVSDAQKMVVNNLFECSGLTTWVAEENMINALTALSGSGPAYLFLFLEALTEAAKKLGLDEALAKNITLQTVSGALALVETSGLSPHVLRKKVTSPAGTTAAAIAILQEQGFEALISRAMQAACDRAAELGKTN